MGPVMDWSSRRRGTRSSRSSAGLLRRNLDKAVRGVILLRSKRLQIGIRFGGWPIFKRHDVPVEVCPCL